MNLGRLLEAGTIALFALIPFFLMIVVIVVTFIKKKQKKEEIIEEQPATQPVK